MSTTRRRRPALIALVIVAAAGCLALAWWQWTRFESASGSFQNLGYAMQWPLFAGFCVYAYYKFVRYEEAPPELRKHDTVTEIPSGLLPERPKAATPSNDDPALREYNAYLADLARADDEDRTNKWTAPETGTPVETIRKALLGYRVMAWTTGIWLIALCYEMVLKYVVHVDNPPNWIAIVHGWVYFVYLIFTANLAVKVRWPIAKTIGVLLAGTIPLVGIIVEHFQTQDIKDKFGL